MYSIGKFAKRIGKTVETLRAWEKKGILVPVYKSESGHRMYSEEQLIEILHKAKAISKINIGYCSSNHQKDDLDRQAELVEKFLINQAKPFKLIRDIGSGINYKKKGLKELLHLVAINHVDTVYVLYKDRLVRFGIELIEEFCALHNTKIVIINQSDDKTNEEELIEDIMNIIHVFSCRMNGKRSHINKKIIRRLENAGDEDSNNKNQ